MMTPVELNRKGFKALVDALGYADAIRFIRQFDEDFSRLTNAYPVNKQGGSK